MARTLSARGAALIADHEGKVNQLYNDPVGHCTIGIGHLVHLGNCDGSEPEEFKRGLSDQEVYDLFISDAGRYIDAVNRLVTVPLTQNQFDALVSFTFNLGEGALEESTLRRKLNAGDHEGAAAEFAKWVKAGGQVLAGLVRRRKDEAELFLTPDEEPTVADLENLHPVFRARVLEACSAAGTSVLSGARSTERQRQLYDDYLAGRGNPANPPGTSWHEFGAGIPGGTYAMAVDFNQPYPHGQPGLIFPIKGEPWHAQPSEIPEPARVAGAENRLPTPTAQRPQEEPVSIIVFDASLERGGGVWQSDGVVRKPVRTGDTWPALEAAGAKHIGVAPNGLFDDLIDIEAALAARIVVTAGGEAVDYGALARALADELHGRLAD